MFKEREKADIEEADIKTGAPAKRAPKKKVAVVAAVVVAVAVLAASGFWVWHKTPSFCGAICHEPMDPYLATYEAEPAAGATDKRGNTVDGSTMLACLHRVEADATCLDCHKPTLSKQVGEGIAWAMGDFESSLEDRSLSDLTAASGKGYETFCLNDACHELLSIESLGVMTSYMNRNVHDFSDAPHAAKVYECSDCHKAHTQSVVICSQCHDDATVPEGWLTYDEYSQIQAG